MIPPKFQLYYARVANRKKLENIFHKFLEELRSINILNNITKFRTVNK